MKRRMCGSPESKIRIDPITGCWIWLAGTSKGYGYLKVNGKQCTAYRYFYVKKYGEVPPGKVLDHIICNNTICCNPDHVTPVLPVANTMRSETNPFAINARKTHCKYGHEFTEENTFKRKNRNQRECKICMRLRGKKYIKINGIRIKK